MQFQWSEYKMAEQAEARPADSPPLQRKRFSGHGRSLAVRRLAPSIGVSRTCIAILFLGAATMTQAQGNAEDWKKRQEEAAARKAALDAEAAAADAELVRLAALRKLAEAQVRDNGTGFDTAAKGPGGHGLAGMHHRVHGCGGQLTVRQHAGSGRSSPRCCTHGPRSRRLPRSARLCR